MQSREPANNVTAPWARKAPLFLLVFFSGFANLAVEVISPRLFSSLFGATTLIWAIVISVTLLGISLGYYLGGQISHRRAGQALPILLIVNAAWLLATSWIIWEAPTYVGQLGRAAIGLTAFAALFVPATIFGMVSPLVITLLSANQPDAQLSKTVGTVYALGTIGSVLGALAAAFYLIPWVGLSTSLRLFAVLLTLFSVYWSMRYYRIGAAAAVVMCLIVPQPSYMWDDPATLLTQREGYYDTIRVYTDGSTFVRMHLGPTYESEMSLQTHEPTFDYARTMIELVSRPTNQRVLVIGGAGHTIARALETRGAVVTEVEIDPIIVEVSDEYFGPLQGDVVVQDGRAYVDTYAGQGFDYVLIDAFSGLYSVPPHLTTLEFFESVSRSLTPGGRMIYNFIGTPTGPRSNSFRAMATTISAAFGDTRTVGVLGEADQNIVFIASPAAMVDLAWPDAPTDGVLLTDDLNPIELFFEQTRIGVEFRR